MHQSPFLSCTDASFETHGHSLTNEQLQFSFDTGTKRCEQSPYPTSLECSQDNIIPSKTLGIVINTWISYLKRVVDAFFCARISKISRKKHTTIQLADKAENQNQESDRTQKACILDSVTLQTTFH